MRGCRVSLVAAVLSAAASITSPIGAAEPPNDGAWGFVVFAVDPQAKDAQAMVDAVRAHLTGLPVRLVIDSENGAGANGADAVKDGAHRIGTLTIDPGTPGEWVVSFTEPAIDTTLVRRIRLKPQGKRVALEEAAIVVRSMVEAILDGGHVGIARARSDEATRSAASLAARPQHGIAATAGYLGTTFAPNLGWQSGALIGLRWQWGGLYAGVVSEIFAPIKTTATTEAPVPILLVRHPGAIVAGYEGSSRVAPTIEIEILADYVTRSTIETEGFLSKEDGARWSFGMGAMGGVAWSFLPRFRLWAQAGADWMINPYAYVAPPFTIVRSASIRPKVGAGLTIDVW